MSDDELFEVFHREYKDGQPVIEGFREPPIPEHRQFERYMRGNCVTDPEEIERYWKEHQAERKKQRGRVQARRG